MISALRDQTITFKLKMSNKPRAKLTNEARNNLYLDYKFLQVEETKRRIEHPESDNRGKGSFDIYRLSAHYCITIQPMYEILKRAKETGCVDSKKSTGRKSKITASMITQIEEIGLTGRTLQAYLKKNPLQGYETKYKGNTVSTPSTHLLRSIAEQPKRGKLLLLELIPYPY